MGQGSNATDVLRTIPLPQHFDLCPIILIAASNRCNLINAANSS
jgi:hypothetical protein